MEKYIDNDWNARKEIRKAKRNIVLVFLLIFVVCPLVMYSVYNRIFPKAEKLYYPDYSLVQSITVSKNEAPVPLSAEESRALYTYISTAKPTRIMSTNETPDVKPFYAVEIKTNDVSTCGYGYIYQENEKFYFEIPYVGVYRLQI